VIYTIDEEGSVRHQAHAHREPEKERLLKELVERYPLDWNSAAVSIQTLRTGRTQFVADMPQALLERIARNPDSLARLRVLDPRSVISVPLRIRSRTFGTISFVSAGSGRRYTSADVTVAEDLAQRVATAIDNAELLDSVTAANQQKDEFLAMLAHELRNPLAAINYASSVMELSDADSQPELLEMIRRQVGNLSHLIDDLLDVSRISRDKIQLRKTQVDAGAIVRRAVAAARHQIDEKRHELILDVDGQKMPLLADATRVEQIVVNLLTNAAKYTPDAGCIQVTARAEGREAVVKVKDSGFGIPPEMLPRVFEMFAQVDRSLDRSQGGLGIGLTVARKLAEMHGGMVTAASEGIGKGSQFTVRLPLSEEVASTETAPAQKCSSGNKLRVLVVDDNRDTALTESLLLAKMGHEVQVAHDGRSALKMAAAFRPQAILLDIGLPELDGYEVAKRLRSQGFEKELIVAVSGYGRSEDMQRSRDAGFDRHLVKPVDLPLLVSVLANTK
jgi:signal transduction histidine kinase/CheY-like chemotaxis protein